LKWAVSGVVKIRNMDKLHSIPPINLGRRTTRVAPLEVATILHSPNKYAKHVVVHMSVANVLLNRLAHTRTAHGRSEVGNGLARRMGGAKRYPSIASYGDDGFRRLNPSYVLNVYWSFAASVYAKTDGVDNKTG